MRAVAAQSRTLDQSSKVLGRDGAGRRRRYALATCITNFPKFSPLKSLSSVSGNVSAPTTMFAFDLIFPSFQLRADVAITTLKRFAYDRTLSWCSAIATNELALALSAHGKNLVGIAALPGCARFCVFRDQPIDFAALGVVEVTMRRGRSCATVAVAIKILCT